MEPLVTVVIDKLVHGGQGIGTLPDGKKVFVWNALPGEEVGVRLLKGKRGWAEAVAEEIIKPSPDRVEPRDEAYLSTSPWQIMTLEAENAAKQAILTETLTREKVAYDKPIELVAAGSPWQYRNKMEYSFWADDSGLHLALFNRGSHGKRIITGSGIARSEIDAVANRICAVLGQAGIRGSQLKTVVARCDQAGEVVAALFVKDEAFPRLESLAGLAKGISVYYSNPKSPASLATKELYSFGDISLADTVMGVPISYDVNSFFQVNLPIFELAAQRIKEATPDRSPKLDFYSGVGTIGIPVGATALIESDPHNIEMAKQNIGGRDITLVAATAETALDQISEQGSLIVDPPRAGLHAKVIERLRVARPEQIVYLSCNPITQARDLALLQDLYQIESITGYNFFPRTPHIESLAILSRR